MFFAISAALAEFERELIRNGPWPGWRRQSAGAVMSGGRAKLAPDQLDMAAQLLAGDRTQREVAKALGVGFSTLRRALKRG